MSISEQRKGATRMAYNMPIDVLLISPRLQSTDPLYCGEQAYTDTLLETPPPGVRYHHYLDLLERGEISRIRGLNILTNQMRNNGLLPPDIWYEVLSSTFVPDVVHIHAFTAVLRFPRARVFPPVVLGTSTGGDSDLKYYQGWDLSRIRRARSFKRWYLRLIDAYDTSLRPEKAQRVITWSNFARQIHLNEGSVHPSQVEVIYPGLPSFESRKRLGVEMKRTPGPTFLFVGRDFERKNGELVLKVFRQIRNDFPDCRLLVVGIKRDRTNITEPGVLHYNSLSRERLIETVYPASSILVLPSKAEGFGLAILEAMSFGLPTIGVNSWAMPEMISHGHNGFLVDPKNLEEELPNYMRLVAERPEILLALRQGARSIFAEKFAIEVHNRKLKRLYCDVITRSGADA